MARPRPKVVSLSPAAADRVKAILADSGKQYLRVGVSNGGCAGMEYLMEYAEAPERLDEVVEDWLDANCLEKLGQSEESRKILERLAGGSRKPAFSDKALSMMALQKLGRNVDAEKVIEDWKGDPAVKRWMTEVLQTGAGSDLELDNVDYRLIREWMRR